MIGQRSKTSGKISPRVSGIAGQGSCERSCESERGRRKPAKRASTVNEADIRRSTMNEKVRGEEAVGMTYLRGTFLF